MEPNYRDLADKYRELPSDQAWSRIKTKIAKHPAPNDHKPIRKEKKWYRVIGLAAVLALTLFWFIGPKVSGHNPERFITGHDYNPTRLEALAPATGRTYTTAMVDETYAIYGS